MVGLYKGSKSWDKAKGDGLKVGTVAETAEASQVVMILLPDQTHKQVYEESIRPALRPGKTLMFAHGFNIHFNQIVPPPDVDVSMIAPKAPGHTMRQVYTEGSGVPALVAVLPEPVRQGQGDGPGLRQGHRQHARRRAWRPPSRKRPRPTSSGSRPCSAAASPRS